MISCWDWWILLNFSNKKKKKVSRHKKGDICIGSLQWRYKRLQNEFPLWHHKGINSRYCGIQLNYNEEDSTIVLWVRWYWTFSSNLGVKLKDGELGPVLYGAASPPALGPWRSGRVPFPSSLWRTACLWSGKCSPLLGGGGRAHKQTFGTLLGRICSFPRPKSTRLRFPAIFTPEWSQQRSGYYGPAVGGLFRNIKRELSQWLTSEIRKTALGAAECLNH